MVETPWSPSAQFAKADYLCFEHSGDQPELLSKFHNKKIYIYSNRSPPRNQVGAPKYLVFVLLFNYTTPEMLPPLNFSLLRPS